MGQPPAGLIIRDIGFKKNLIPNLSFLRLPALTLHCPRTPATRIAAPPIPRKTLREVGPRACVKARRRARTRSQRAIDYARSGILHVAGETAFHDDERHRGRANARPMYRGDAARVFARANLLFATTTTPSAATCSSGCSSARGSTGGFPESFRGQRHRRCRRARRASSSASVFARAGWIFLIRTDGAARQKKAA